MELNLRGKTVLITGGSKGIGKAVAEVFAEEGGNVHLVARDAATLTATADELRAAHQTNVTTSALDLSDSANIPRLQDACPAPDILVNNAGVAWGAPLEEFPEVGWDKVMDTNVKGVFFLTQKLLPLLEKNADSDNPSHVVNVGSIDGIKTPVFDNFSYGPSKAAVHHLTRVLAAHLIKRSIIVNGIAPGPFPTYMLSTGVGAGGDTENTDWDAVGKRNPRGRVGTAEDIAGLAIFLSSRACGFTVGDVITCDGGTVVS